MYYVGIDPGVEPAICVLDEKGKIVENVLIKKTQFKKDSAGFNFQGVCDILSKYKEEECIAYLEDVHSVFNSSAKANFNFGGSKFALEQACYSYKIPCKLIQPKLWQKYIWKEEDIQMKKKQVNKKLIKDTKLTSYNAVKRVLGEKYRDELFLPTKRSRVPNDNMIDAYLISRCALEMNKYYDKNT